MATINVNDELWIPFLQQSVGLKTSASERIREFIKDELKEGKK